MICEDYVSFETAKLLKEKGFDGILPFIYVDTEKSDREVHLTDTLCNYNDCHIKDVISAPTLQMAMMWLRKKHNLVISTSFTVDGWHSYVSQIKLDSEGFVVDIIDGIDDGNIPNCDTYEKSCEAAIKYCLENLI